MHQKNIYKVNAGNELAIYPIDMNLSLSALNPHLRVWHSYIYTYIFFKAFLRLSNILIFLKSLSIT